MAGKIRAGIGGWTFEPWRGVFYPDGLRQKDELAYASRHVTVIEVNATYYSMQKPESWAKWAAEVPEDFTFAVKGSRYCTNRRVLAEAGPGIERFLSQGFTQLGPRLGPILWQFMATKKFDPEDFAGFLDLLPPEWEGVRLRHVVEVRHDSFMTPEFVALCRERGVAICLADHATYPMIADVTADFVYARLQTGSDDIATGYPPEALDLWARRLSTYAEGGRPEDLPTIEPAPPPKTDREVFAFFIHEGKVRAPAAAMALLERVGA
ncbi:MAG: DUF72 domain-containing protein [Phenylobacterium sp.]|nr:DUF72 domain-containing protein [Phenylobacterium sp.]